MQEFLSDLARYPFLQYALAAGLLASISCGVIGSFVAARRITYIAGAISHCVLAGLGAALYINRAHGVAWLDPIHGAVVAALVSAGIIALVSLRAGEKEDTLIGAMWAVGMALGVMFISRTPGYNQDLMSYLFGNILMVSPTDLKLLALLGGVVVVSTAIFYNRFLLVCFDEEYARVRGLNVEAYYIGLLMLTALTVVALVTVVGIVMVIALLTLPVAIAGGFTSVLWRQMLLAVVLSALLTTSGLAVSYGPDLPAGATIVLLSGAAYLVVSLVKRLKAKRIVSRQKT